MIEQFVKTAQAAKKSVNAFAQKGAPLLMSAAIAFGCGAAATLSSCGGDSDDDVVVHDYELIPGTSIKVYDATSAYLADIIAAFNALNSTPGGDQDNFKTKVKEIWIAGTDSCTPDGVIHLKTGYPVSTIQSWFEYYLTTDLAKTMQEDVILLASKYDYLKNIINAKMARIEAL